MSAPARAGTEPNLPFRLLALSVAIVLVSTLPTFLVGATFFDLGPDLGIGPFGLGLLTGLFFLTAAVSSPILGRWVQRVGWQRAMRTNVVCTATIAALIPVLVDGPVMLGGLLMASAILYGSSNPAANQALARHTGTSRMAFVFGIKHAGIPASTLVAGLLVPALVVGYGWRAAYVVAAVAAALVWLLIPRVSDRGVPPVVPRRIERPWAVRDLRTLAVVSALGAVAANALGTFVVSAAIAVDFTETAAGWLQFAGSGASISARVISGWLADRHGGALRGIVGLMGTGSLVFVALTFVAGPFFAVAILAAYATGWGWPGLMTATVVSSDRATAASSSSITQAGVFVGAGAGPLILGLLIEHVSYSVMWATVAVSLVCGALLARSVDRSRPVAATDVGT